MSPRTTEATLLRRIERESREVSLGIAAVVAILRRDESPDPRLRIAAGMLQGQIGSLNTIVGEVVAARRGTERSHTVGVVDLREALAGAAHRTGTSVQVEGRGNARIAADPAAIAQVLTSALAFAGASSPAHLHGRIERARGGAAVALAWVDPARGRVSRRDPHLGMLRRLAVAEGGRVTRRRGRVASLVVWFPSAVPAEPERSAS